ncbi:MFS transporter [Streptomyces sp. NPDC013157]|uniref:MFS transporter n=1 Tax=Streptomyces sp. NPDC013157 TaxID=3364861 RepID=UPI0036B434B3
MALLLVWPAQLLTVVGSIGSNAMPQIAEHMRTPHIAWFTVTFVLVSLMTVPFAMKLGSVFGKRRIMVILTAAGLVGDIVAAVAPNFTVMLIGRAMGGFYGPVVPLVMASVREIFPRAWVSTVYGIITGSIGIAQVGSPLLAGWLIDDFGWRAALWSLVISTLVAGACLLAMPETPRKGTVRNFDWAGGLLLGGGVALLVFGIGKGGSWGWTAAGTMICLVAGVAALVGFVLVELRVQQPVVHVRILARRAVAAAVIVPSLVQGVFFVVPTVLTFLALYPAIPHVSDGLGWSVTHTAVVGIAAGVVTVLAGVAVGRLLRRTGPRLLWFVSTGTLSVGLLLAGLYHGDEVEIILTGVVIGLGGGMLVSTVGSMIVSVVSLEDQPAASGISSLLYQASGALTYQLLFLQLDDHSTVMRGVTFYADAGFRNAYFVLAGLVAVGFLLTLGMPRLQRPEQALQS